MPPPASPALAWPDRPSRVLAFFAALTAAMTYPLVFRLSSWLPYGSGDLWQNYWNFWWWKKALLDLGTSPYRSELVYHPVGADLIFHTHSSFNMLAAMPANVWWGPAAAYNVCVLAAIALSGFGAWLLVREWTGSGEAGVIAGAIFAYFPQHIEQTLEHLNLMSTQFLPVALYFLLRLQRGAGWGAAAGLGVAFALNALCSWHLGLYLTLLLVPLAAVGLLRAEGGRVRLLLRLAAAAATAAAVVAPAVLPLLREIASGATYYAKPIVDRGIDPVYLLIPHFGQPLWGGLVTGRYIERAYQNAGFICYLGFVPLGLAALAVRRRAPGWGLWAAVALATLTMALGARPFWNGELLEGVRLPFGWIETWPVFKVLRVANRYLILTSLALAALAGLGYAALRRKSPAVFSLSVGLVCLEYAWLPYPLQPVAFPPAYGQMLDGPILRIGAVLDIPFHERSRTVHNLAMQTVHQRPIADGYLSTYPPEVDEWIRGEPALADLAGVPKLERPIDFARLVALGFDTVVVHKYRAESYSKRMVEATPRSDLLARKEALRMGGIPDEKLAEVRRQLNERCGGAAFEDDRVAIYYLPAATAPRSASE